MDELDRDLLALLRQNARMPAASLAKVLRVSRATVQNRIDRMRDRGDILGFTLRSPAEGTQGQVRAIMSIAVEGRKGEAVSQALCRFPEVEAVHTTNGRWDLIAALVTRDLSGFSAVLDAVRLIDGVTATETSLLLATRRP
ncbi:MAG: Lrp/AsnC family transcriptional regulator [Bradyrhizobium sp.]|nr:Lrp/AsnC family transcriptional regulator [Bradyrhizobium sp.]